MHGPAALALAVLSTLSTHAHAMTAKFTRASDVFGMGAAASARDVVNVLGRWQKHTEWDSIGELQKIDELFDSEGRVVEGPALREAWNVWRSDPKHATRAKRLSPEDEIGALPPWDGYPAGYKLFSEEQLAARNPARSPARRGFTLRRGLVQRYWHAANVPQLGFTSEAMAASVGSSAAELDATPIDPLACDVVFDALTRSQSGIIDRDEIDAQRAKYQTADGGFDADAFAADVSAAKLNVLVAKAIFPGLLYVIFGVAFIQADGIAKALESVEQIQATINGNMALWGRMAGGG